MKKYYLFFNIMKNSLQININLINLNIIFIPSYNFTNNILIKEKKINNYSDSIKYKY